MRLAVVLLLNWLLAAAVAEAAPKTPHFKRGTPYSVVRAELLRQGFAPVRVLEPPHKFCGDFCAPELESCAVDVEKCLWLYARRADGALFQVTTSYESRLDRGQFRARGTHRLEYMEYIPLSWVSDLIIVMPNGRVIRGANHSE